MNNMEFVTLQRELGLEVVETDGSYWVVSDNKTAVSTPSLEPSQPTIESLSQLFRLGVKATTFVVKADDTNSYEYVYEGNNYTIDQFKSKIRNQIRKGLKSCEIRKPTIDELSEAGLLINREILSKHERDVVYLTDNKLWTEYSTKLLETKDVYTYGAFVDGILAGYLFFIKVNSKYYIYHPYASRKYSKQAPMNALLFTAINDFIKKDGEVSVSYGLASFFEKQGLDHFKKGMLFYEKPVARVLALPKYKGLIFSDFLYSIFNRFKNIEVLNKKYMKYESLYKAHKLYKKYLINCSLM